MRRTLGVLRLAALAVAGLVALGMPLPAEARPPDRTSSHPLAPSRPFSSRPSPRQVCRAPVGAFRAKNPTALRTAKVQAQAKHSPPAPTTPVRHRHPSSTG